MEVSGGRLLKSSNKSPLNAIRVIEKGKKEAKGFCQTCTEYFCVDWYKCHCKNTIFF
jgi:hypothetical protein